MCELDFKHTREPFCAHPISSAEKWAGAEGIF